MKVRRSYIDARKRLRMLDSLHEHYKVMLADFNITSSPTVTEELDLSYYIINECKSHGITNYKSLRTSVPIVLKLEYLYYLQTLITDKSDSFFYGLQLIVGYLETKQEIQALYNFDGSLNDVKVNDSSRCVTVRKIKKKDKLGRPYYTVRDIVSPFNSVHGDLLYKVRITDIYYSYFKSVTGLLLGGEWTFFQGLTRDQEERFISLVLEGQLAPTNREIRYAWATYLSDILSNGVSIFQELEDFIEREQLIAIEDELEKNPDIELKYMGYFSVGFTSKYDKNAEYPVYLTNIAWDSVLDKPLPIVNNINGIGGEFVYRPETPNDRVYLVEYFDGSTVRMYKKTKAPRVSTLNLNLAQFYSSLSNPWQPKNNWEFNFPLYEVDDDSRDYLHYSLSSMERSGIYSVNKAK